MDFSVSWLFKKKLWFVPYVLHLAIAVGIGYWLDNPWISVAYFLGMMSHPLQGWLVNAFGHAIGYRNFNLEDNSRNNTWWRGRRWVKASRTITITIPAVPSSP